MRRYEASARECAASACSLHRSASLVPLRSGLVDGERFMKRIVKFLVICVLVLSGCYGAYILAYPTYHVRYRLSLDVEVDGKVQTSSGVVEIEYPITSDHRFGEGRKFGGYLHGNAITIDLGARGLIFVVNMFSVALVVEPNGERELKRPHSTFLTDLPLEAYGLPRDGLPSRMSIVVQQLEQETGSIDIPLDRLPMLVRFRNIEDQMSIEEIEPDEFAATFGPGVKLLRARLELTRDPITLTPSVWPRWLAEAKTAGFFVKARPEGNARFVNLTLYDFKGV